MITIHIKQGRRMTYRDDTVIKAEINGYYVVSALSH